MCDVATPLHHWAHNQPKPKPPPLHTHTHTHTHRSWLRQVDETYCRLRDPSHRYELACMMANMAASKSMDEFKGELAEFKALTARGPYNTEKKRLMAAAQEEAVAKRQRLQSESVGNGLSAGPPQDEA